MHCQDTTRCKNDPRKCKALQKGSAQVVHPENHACYKAMLGSATPYNKAVHERCTSTRGAKAIQGSATSSNKAVHGRCTAMIPRGAKVTQGSTTTWYKKAIDGDALPGHRAVQRDPRQCNMVQKRSARRSCGRCGFGKPHGVAKVRLILR
jgi:hypothetical protein